MTTLERKKWIEKLMSRVDENDKALMPVVQDFIEGKLGTEDLNQLVERIKKLAARLEQNHAKLPDLDEILRKDFDVNSTAQKALRGQVAQKVKAAKGRPLFGTYALGIRTKANAMQKLADAETMEKIRQAAGINDLVWGVLGELLDQDGLEKFLTAVAKRITEEEQAGAADDDKKTLGDNNPGGKSLKALPEHRVLGIRLKK